MVSMSSMRYLAARWMLLMKSSGVILRLRRQEASQEAVPRLAFARENPMEVGIDRWSERHAGAFLPPGKVACGGWGRGVVWEVLPG